VSAATFQRCAWGYLAARVRCGGACVPVCAGMADADVERVRRVFVGAISVLLLLAFEARVVFGSFRSFIALPWPLAAALVTAVLLLGAFTAFQLVIVGDKYAWLPCLHGTPEREREGRGGRGMHTCTDIHAYIHTYLYTYMYTHTHATNRTMLWVLAMDDVVGVGSVQVCGDAGRADGWGRGRVWGGRRGVPSAVAARRRPCHRRRVPRRLPAPALLYGMSSPTQARAAHRRTY
jgi:hypothetical protein